MYSTRVGGALLLGKGGGPAIGRGTSPGAAALKLFTDNSFLERDRHTIAGIILPRGDIRGHDQVQELARIDVTPEGRCNNTPCYARAF